MPIRKPWFNTYSKWFCFWKYFRTLSQNSSRNKVFRMFSSQTTKTFFTNSFLIFWLTSRRFLSKIFCWLFSPKRLFLAMRNLGRITSLFLECFILQVTKSLFLENGWICGENHGMIYWVFVAENSRVAQVVSGNFQLTLSTPSLLAAQAFSF